jgi:hypothetical protein
LLRSLTNVRSSGEILIKEGSKGNADEPSAACGRNQRKRTTEVAKKADVREREVSGFR